MPTTDSPLRYPGGKTSLYPFVQNILQLNKLNEVTYIEPFAGGAGLAFRLLFNKNASRIVINDADPAIFSFWHCVLNRTAEMCTLIQDVNVTIDEWDKQKEIFVSRGNGDLLAYGFSTLFLNRTNVSGVLKGGIIGGRDQYSKDKIYARFNKATLINKINRIGEMKHFIKLYNLDAYDLMNDIVPGEFEPFINFDPPYVKKGSHLYSNYYTSDDHYLLGAAINNFPYTWMVTYDNCALIRGIYSNRRQCLLPTKYSAGSTKFTHEIGIFSDNLILPTNIQLI